MKSISREEYDKLVLHTIRIELKDGSVLIYYVTVESKTALFNLLKQDAIADEGQDFLWLYIPQDRLVLMNKKEIIRVTFCFDVFGQVERLYRDNFGILDKSEEPVPTDDATEEVKTTDEELYLPQLIVKHNRQMEKNETEGYFGNISSYSSLSKGNVDGFDFEYDENEDEWILFLFKYLEFVDDDGEYNFMPLDNLSVIEIERSLIMTEEFLNLYLGRKPKKQRIKK